MPNFGRLQHKCSNEVHLFWAKLQLYIRCLVYINANTVFDARQRRSDLALSTPLHRHEEGESRQPGHQAGHQPPRPQRGAQIETTILSFLAFTRIIPLLLSLEGIVTGLVMIYVWNTAICSAQMDAVN